MTTVVGRLRPDPLFHLKFVVLSHNTLRGAAGGSILNAELLVKNGDGGLMKNYGRSTLESFLGNRVVYRNLVPADPNLPALQTVARQIGLAPGTIPRKTDPDYALVILYLLNQAQRQRGIQHKIERLIYIGDTRLLDGTAFTNLCQAGNLPGLAFIGAENSQPAAIEILNQTDAQTLYLANRWSALAEFAIYAAQNGFAIDERTAVVVDIDKTALGRAAATAG